MGRNGHKGRAPSTTQAKLGRYLDELIDWRVFRTRGEIAAACGTTDAGLSDVLNEDLNRRLSVEQCLRLARTVKAHPVTVLRMAGRDEAADVLDDVWPRKRNLVHLTRSEQELVKQWRELTLDYRHHVGAMIVVAVAGLRASLAGTRARARAGRRASTLTSPRVASR